MRSIVVAGCVTIAGLTGLAASASPPGFVGKIQKECWTVPLPDKGYPENPCSLTGDFDGDGKRDIAAQVREIEGKRRRGIHVHFGTGRDLMIGAGTPLSHGGDDFSWMKGWRVMQANEARTFWRGKPKPVGDAILADDSEAAAGAIAWIRGRFVWHQYSD